MQRSKVEANCISEFAHRLVGPGLYLHVSLAAAGAQRPRWRRLPAPTAARAERPCLLLKRSRTSVQAVWVAVASAARCILVPECLFRGVSLERREAVICANASAGRSIVPSSVDGAE